MDNKKVILKKISTIKRLLTSVMFIGLLGILSSPLVWIWVGFGMFIKSILSYVVIMLIGKFVNHEVTGIEDAVKKVEEKPK